ncbi:hypothetical protein F7725_013967 [Dissostichus mawsoni]|uniref:Uncharacterized protein n=1 Tax=Dissostichus mawsoni TaxID=36200 RepID=A0A7J5YX25_DISMA|nr:hypothetical protein F7725_013967 [Dissostichus mawsoni]
MEGEDMEIEREEMENEAVTSESTKIPNPTDPAHVQKNNIKYNEAFDPAFELDDGVSEGAAVLALAAVSNLVATNIELTERVQRTHLTVAHVGRPHHVHQAPAEDRETQL